MEVVEAGTKDCDPSPKREQFLGLFGCMTMHVQTGGKLKFEKAKNIS